ncbi:MULTISPECIES: hypothetical protein [Luteimonas]|nr:MULTISPECIES: hypothetical protein [Luteimonas]
MVDNAKVGVNSEQDFVNQPLIAGLLRLRIASVILHIEQIAVFDRKQLEK